MITLRLCVFLFWSLCSFFSCSCFLGFPSVSLFLSSSDLLPLSLLFLLPVLLCFGNCFSSAVSCAFTSCVCGFSPLWWSALSLLFPLVSCRVFVCLCVCVCGPGFPSLPVELSFLCFFASQLSLVFWVLSSSSSSFIILFPFCDLILGVLHLGLISSNPDKL